MTCAGGRSMFVLMEVETLGAARSLGWKVHMRCANGYRQETRSMRRCIQTPFIRDGLNTTEGMAMAANKVALKYGLREWPLVLAGRGVGVQK